MPVTQGATLTWSSGAAQGLQGLSNMSAGEWDVYVRALSSDIYMGNSGISGSATGFLLVQDKDYVLRIRVIQGTTQDNTPYVWQGSGANKTLTYMVVPVG